MSWIGLLSYPADCRRSIGARIMASNLWWPQSCQRPPKLTIS